MAFLLFRASGWQAVARAGVAAAALIGVTAAYFGPREFLLWTVTGNGGYLALRGSLPASILRGIGMTSAFVAMNGVIIWCCVVARRRGRVDWDLWLWLGGAAVAVLAGFRFFGHYYLQLVPPLALIGAMGLPTVARQWRLAVAGLAVPVVAMWLFAFSPPNARGIIPYRDVADRVRALTTPADRIFVWGEYPEIYWAANREPATRFIHTGFITGNSGGRDAAEVEASDGVPGAWDFLAADIAATPPDLIVDTGPASIRHSDLHPLEETFLWDEIVRHYLLVDVVDGVRLFQRIGS